MKDGARPRCRWAIGFDGIATRCRLNAGHGGRHEGPHLKDIPYGKIKWFKGDAREFESDRAAVYAWRRKPAP